MFRPRQEDAMVTRTMNRAHGKEHDMAPARMMAIVADRYGPPRTLTLREIDVPALDHDRVLVRVRAASLNPADLHSFTGALVGRVASRALWKPPTNRVGSDVAGVVEAVGADVTDLRPGDEVFGTAPGSVAQYANARYVVPKPASLSFEQAAAIGIAGITALQGLRDKAQVQPGQTVLINGAAGGVGTFAVQIAKALGAEVTGVCSTKNVGLVRDLGADHVIDYTSEDFARMGQRYDLVLDTVGNRSLRSLRRAVAPGGMLMPIGGGHNHGHGGRGMLRALGLLGRAALRKRLFHERVAMYIAQINKADLQALAELCTAGKLTPAIDRTYPLSEAPEAYSYLQAGHARAKIVITV
jgi:NADPH:quinone reductase-like Zn-dependent oxidoreductase